MTFFAALVGIGWKTAIAVALTVLLAGWLAFNWARLLSARLPLILAVIRIEGIRVENVTVRWTHGSTRIERTFKTGLIEIHDPLDPQARRKKGELTIIWTDHAPQSLSTKVTIPRRPAWRLWTPTTNVILDVAPSLGVSKLEFDRRLTPATLSWDAPNLAGEVEALIADKTSVRFEYCVKIVYHDGRNVAMTAENRFLSDASRPVYTLPAHIDSAAVQSWSVTTSLGHGSKETAP